MEERSLAETPTWSVATVLTAMVAVGLAVEKSILHLRKWLVRTRRRALLAALETIVEEMMVFGLLSLLLGHWAVWISRICVKETVLRTRFHPCLEEAFRKVASGLNSTNLSGLRKLERHGFCPEGHKPFVDYESLEQLHRFLLVLCVIHVFYCFFTVTVAMVKVYSWRVWEAQAESIPIEDLQGSTSESMKAMMIRQQSTLIFHHTFHSWSQHKVLIWMICFIRQFWSSIDRADYMALRFGFITNHKLFLSYNFHNYMLRSMEDEFRSIVGISVPLWGFAMICILLNVQGTNAYFWLSLLPAVLIVAVGTKLQHIVIKLALEIRDENPCEGNQLKPHDGLFWFGKPELLMWLIQLISFQNAFEMATLIWSLWEINATSCFMTNRVFLMIRLTSGILVQFWCSYCTFPLYVIITQMGSKLKKALFGESVRESLLRWQKRANSVKHKSKQDICSTSLTTASSNVSLDLMGDGIDGVDDVPTNSNCMNSLRAEKMSSFCKTVEGQDWNHGQPQNFKPFQVFENLEAADMNIDDDGDGGENDGSKNDERQY